MHRVSLCDLDITDIKPFDNVALYPFRLQGLGRVLFVRKCWVGLGRSANGSSRVGSSKLDPRPFLVERP